MIDNHDDGQHETRLPGDGGASTDPPAIDSRTRDSIAEAYFEQLPFTPYPVQEEALFAWFTSQQGVLVCAPTGTGKTLIAEAAVFEALRLGKRAYYTTPLIALTDQKYRELRQTVQRWGYSPDVVGLVTGNRKVNPSAPIQVVVAEILLNRLLDPDFANWGEVWAIVMDEFHSFNDPERGIVWEFGLGLLPKHVRTLLLSATVGNSSDFVNWLRFRHQRALMLVEGRERKIPLTFQWVEDQTLPEQMELMFDGEEQVRQTPALVFCFNRDQCWTVAELFKGKALVTSDQKTQLMEELERFDWSQGAGPKLKQILQRGIGVHHAGVLPRYRRIVEDLFQKKLLSVAVCTETLAAGINLPARAVVLPTLMKGPFDKKTLVEPSSAHQMFGRAGRPQFDDRGFVIALAHEDDVKYNRWKEKYDQIPEDTKDPGLLKAKKQLKKKMPRRREGIAYWTEKQFEQLQTAKSANLESRGPIPWQLLAYMLNLNPKVELLRQLIGKRLLPASQMESQILELNRRLVALWRGRFIELDPPPPFEREDLAAVVSEQLQRSGSSNGSDFEDDDSEAEDNGKLPPNGTDELGDKSTAVRSEFGAGLFDDQEEATASQAPGASEPHEPLSGDCRTPSRLFAAGIGAEHPDSTDVTERESATDHAIESTSDQQASGHELVESSGDVNETAAEATLGGGWLAAALQKPEDKQALPADTASTPAAVPKSTRQKLLEYEPIHAHPTPRLDDFIRLRAIHPVFGMYLIDHLAIADDEERILAVESLLEMPASVGNAIRVPWPEELPPGRLATEVLHPRLLRLGLATVEELVGRVESEDEPRVWTETPPPRIVPLPHQIQRLFQYDNPGIDDVKIKPVWVIGRLREFG